MCKFEDVEDEFYQPSRSHHDIFMVSNCKWDKNDEGRWGGVFVFWGGGVVGVMLPQSVMLLGC